MKDFDIRRRREALQITQKELAEAVARRAGMNFSQQSLQKLESKPNASSRFMHHILDILNELEGGARAKAKQELDRVDERHLDSILAFLKTLNQQDRNL